LNSPESRLLLVTNRPSATRNLEQKACVELAARLGRSLTDQEWSAVRRKLREFVEIPREWDLRRITERNNSQQPAPVEIYPKAA